VFPLLTSFSSTPVVVVVVVVVFVVIPEVPDQAVLLR